MTNSENDNRRHVLLVGGGGYVGGAVTNGLLARGYKVRVLDLLVYDHNRASLGFGGRDGYQFIYGDMGDAETFDRALEGVSDVVILGGLVGDPITKKFPEESGLINDEAVRGCIDRLNGKGLDRVIFISTCSNYGMIGEDEIADESFALKPLSLYAKSKVAAEDHILSLDGKADFRPTVLRFATAFGLAPRMRFDLTVNEFARELYLGRELVVYDAHTWRPYCHVNDFARLIDHVLKSPAQDVAFEVFNAGCDANNHTKQSIIDIILRKLPNRKVVFQANSADPRNYRVSFEKLRSKLGFEPVHTVEDGIDEIFGALSNHLFDDADSQRDYYGNYALPGLRHLETGKKERKTAS